MPYNTNMEQLLANQKALEEEGIKRKERERFERWLQFSPEERSLINAALITYSGLKPQDWELYKRCSALHVQIVEFTNVK